MDFVVDEHGKPVTRWDGRSFKKHPVTGEDVPDEAAQTPQERYLNPRKAAWPEAEFVVGNPPFIGASRMRDALGDGYTEALRNTWPHVPESSDFVMYWWHHAAELTRAGALRQFGLITTNSIRQTFNRRVIEQHLNPVIPAKLVPDSDPGAGIQAARAARRTATEETTEKLDSRLRGNDGAALVLTFAVPDHPWVDSGDGAAVRIAMTVGAAPGADAPPSPRPTYTSDPLPHAGEGSKSGRISSPLPRAGEGGRRPGEGAP